MDVPNIRKCFLSALFVLQEISERVTSACICNFMNFKFDRVMHNMP